MTFQYLLQLVISGLVIGSIYSAVALGFVIIYKATRVVNFAQGELLMVGAYVCFAFLVQMHVPFWAALLLTILFGMVLAMFVERLILRPMIGEPIISIIMVTIGLSLVLRSLVAAIWGTEILVYEPKLFPQEMIEIAGLPISLEFVWCFILSLVLLAVFSVFFKYSKAGVAMRATAFNQQVAQSMGISVKHIFALGDLGGRIGDRGSADRQHQRDQQFALPLRAEGLPGHHPGRARLHPGRRDRRDDHRDPGESVRRVREDVPELERRQGGRAVRLPGHHPDDQALRPLRHEGNREGIGKPGEPQGDA